MPRRRPNKWLPNKQLPRALLPPKVVSPTPPPPPSLARLRRDSLPPDSPLPDSLPPDSPLRCNLLRGNPCRGSQALRRLPTQPSLPTRLLLIQRLATRLPASK